MDVKQIDVLTGNKVVRSFQRNQQQITVFLNYIFGLQIQPSPDFSRLCDTSHFETMLLSDNFGTTSIGTKGSRSGS